MGLRPDGYSTSRTALSVLQRNILQLREEFPVTAYGYFGVRGKGKNVRLVYHDNPLAASKRFWAQMTRDAEVDLTENGHPRVRFQDGSQVTYRLQTSTPNSPGIAITIRTSGLGLARFQRIHFIRKSSE